MAFSVLPQRDRLGITTSRLFIDGEWRPAENGAVFPHVHPSTNEEVSSIACGSSEDINQAVVAARRAFDGGPWSKLGARERGRFIKKYVDVLYEHAEELAYLQTMDNGIPLNFSLNTRVSAKNAADIFNHYEGWTDKINGEVYPQFTSDLNLQYMSMREPVGVVAAIIPWNAPVMMYAMKVAPALAAGCTVVMKPSELASLSAIRLSELISEIGLPPGVFNLVTGGAETGQALVTHPGIDKVTFTGSPSVGEYIVSKSGTNMKRVTLELGGKSAAIVFPDAIDVEATAQAVMGQCSTFLSGQVCSTTSRALVHQSIYDRFINAAHQQISSVRFGDPFDVETTSAPIISKRQVERIMQYIETGKQEGAELVFGGDRPDNELLAEGNWINPTLFANVDNRMTIAQEEIFGPVLSVIPFRDEEEAVRLANDSVYGLAGAVYTADLQRAFRIAKAVRTGAIGINGYSVMPNSPAGGIKRSGIGREGGWSTIEAYTELKTVILNLG